VRERLVFDGKRMRQKAVYRKTVDPNGDLAVYLKVKLSTIQFPASAGLLPDKLC